MTDFAILTCYKHNTKHSSTFPLPCLVPDLLDRGSIVAVKEYLSLGDKQTNMASSPKDKFEAAVKVIRGLPKNGSFQPSHELMLKFYSYFKQATEGPCRSPKPAFWDLVNKKKWEAWTSLGDMQREEAMLLYVDELKKIVETMPQTEAVTEFLQKLDNFYEMVEDNENHNTLKSIDKTRQNGSIYGKGSSNENGDETGEQLSSYRVAQLLKHDVKWWRDSSGMLSGRNGPTNGLGPGFEHNGNGSSHSYFEYNDAKKDGYNTENQEKIQIEQKPHSDRISTEEWEQIGESRLSISQSNSSGDSESEIEEFCDTSDDPVELANPISPHTFASYLTSLAENSATSTPVNGGKSVHFDPSIDMKDSQISDSLIVNMSQVITKTSELSDYGQQEEISPIGILSDEGHDGDLDILMCRGGEDQDTERRRHGGDQGARDRTTSTSRGGHSNIGGAAGGSNTAGGGQRDLFPGPGGGGGWRGTGSGGSIGTTDLNEQIVVTLLRLQHDMSGVLNRLNSLEALVKESKKDKDKTVKASKGWWPFADLSVKSALLVFIWPLLVHLIITYISHRRRKLRR